MKKSYECEVATHIGPESCGAARKSSVEALTGERAGRVLSRVRPFLRDADAVGESGRPHPARQAAGKDRKLRFTALLHHIYNLDTLRMAYFSLKKEAEERRVGKECRSRWS